MNSLTHAPLPRQDSHELQSIQPFTTPSTRTRKGKGKEREPEESDEIDQLNDSEDEEIEGLLQQGQDTTTDNVETVNEEEGEGRGSGHVRKRSASDSKRIERGRGKGNGGWNKMNTTQRKRFLKGMLVETLPVFFLVLVGAILTGELLDKLQSWRVFIRIEELFILVPILLNLKGNLEMNLAARFSTSANIGELDLKRTRRSLILGNLALLQVQALIVSLISGLLAFLLGLASRKGVHHALQHPVHKGGIGLGNDELRGGYFEALLVLVVSMLAAGISSGVLGSFMCSLVVVCRRFKINPDNVATPIAAMLGDVVTLVILGGLASLFAKFMGTIISTLVFILLLIAVGFNLVFTFRNAYVQELLSVGWGPLFLAMAISSGSGVVLETYVQSYPGFSLLAPIFTSISGATSSVFVARTSTALHSGKEKDEPFWISGGVLFGLGVAVMGLSWGFGWITGQVPRGMGFGLCYLGVSALQTILGLVIAQQGSMLLWKWDYDPDVYALPLLSSFLDVSGQLFLVGAFAISTTPTKSALGEVVGSELGGGGGGKEVLDGLIKRYAS